MIKTSYNQVHGDYNDDFELDDIDLIDYEHDEARRVGTFEEAMVSWSSFLRGGRTNGLGATRIWKGVMWNEGRIDCNLCVDWDGTFRYRGIDLGLGFVDIIISYCIVFVYFLLLYFV